MKRDDLAKIMGLLGLRVTSENVRSHYLNTSCPFAPFGAHSRGTDQSSSFGCRYDDQGVSSYKCYACKQHGTMRNLARRLGELRRVDYSAILEQVAALESGLIDPTFDPFERPDEYQPELMPLNEALYDGLYPPAWEVPEARAYLQARRISPETSENLGLLYRDTYPVTRDDGTVGTWFRGDILFPVRDRDNRLYGWSGRTTRDAHGVKPKVYDPDLPKRHLILGEERWQEGRPKLIVEGLFGYAHLIDIGVEEFCDVGALMGSVLTPEKAAILKSWGDPVVAVLDNDEAGDVGLFGSTRPEDGQRDERQALVPQLIQSVLVMVPGWPVRPDDTFKQDPDELTYEEVYSMVFETTPLPAPKMRSKFSVDKHLNRR